MSDKAVARSTARALWIVLQCVDST